MKTVILQVPIEIINSDISAVSNSGKVEIQENVHVRVSAPSADLLDENGNKIGKAQIPAMKHFFIDRIALFHKEKEEINED